MSIAPVLKREPVVLRFLLLLLLLQCSYYYSSFPATAPVAVSRNRICSPDHHHYPPQRHSRRCSGRDLPDSD
uniref:Putative secreted protein n=1 Tax=Anopheles darlingi TaxID=43151 RepID=A0A2M4D883_ANODA